MKANELFSIDETKAGYNQNNLGNLPLFGTRELYTRRSLQESIKQRNYFKSERFFK